MRKLIFLLLTATVLWSCQNATFTIKGTVIDPAFEGANVYLQERIEGLCPFRPQLKSIKTLETATIQNGTFTFTGMADENALRYVSLDEQNRVPVLLERGTINVTFDDVIMVSGTRINTEFSEIQRRRDELSQKERASVQILLEKRGTGTLTDEMVAEHNKIREEMHNLTVRFIKNNIGNEAGKYILRTTIHGFELETQEELLALTDDNFRAEPSIANIITRLENYRNVAVGNKFVDFTLQDPKGNEVSLSDFAGQGNYVLVSFWATWCGPCIWQVPYLVELYAKYKSRGFEIVGVSFDTNHDAWVNGIERLNITWVQMSDLQGPLQSPVWDLYAIRGIPHSVLLDREGTIIANNLRDGTLDRKLAELMP